MQFNEHMEQCDRERVERERQIAELQAQLEAMLIQVSLHYRLNF
jgi:hypothetical protein